MDILLNNINTYDEIALEDGEIDEECVSEVVVETPEELVREDSSYKEKVKRSDVEICDKLSVKSKKRKGKKSSHRKRQLSSNEIQYPNNRKKLKSCDEISDNLSPSHAVGQLSNERHDCVMENKDFQESELDNDMGGFVDTNGKEVSESSVKCKWDDDEECIIKSIDNKEEVTDFISKIRNENEAIETKKNRKHTGSSSSDCVFISEDNTKVGSISQHIYPRRNRRDNNGMGSDNAETNNKNDDKKDRGHKNFEYKDKVDDYKRYGNSSHSKHTSKKSRDQSSDRNSWANTSISRSNHKDRGSRDEAENRHEPKNVNRYKYNDDYNEKHARDKTNDVENYNNNQDSFNSNKNYFDFDKRKNKDNGDRQDWKHRSVHKDKFSYKEEKSSERHTMHHGSSSKVSGNHKSAHTYDNRNDSYTSSKRSDSHVSDKRSSSHFDNHKDDKNRDTEYIKGNDGIEKQSWNYESDDGVSSNNKNDISSKNKDSFHSDKRNNSSNHDNVSNGYKKDYSHRPDSKEKKSSDHVEKKTWNYESDDASSSKIVTVNQANLHTSNNRNDSRAPKESFNYGMQKEKFAPYNSKDSYSSHNTKNKDDGYKTDNYEKNSKNNVEEVVEKQSWNYESDNETSSNVVPVKGLVGTDNRISSYSNNRKDALASDSNKESLASNTHGNLGNVYGQDMTPSSVNTKEISNTEIVEKQSWNYESDEDSSNVASGNQTNSSISENHKHSSAYENRSHVSENRNSNNSSNNKFKQDRKSTSDNNIKILNKNIDEDVEKQAWGYVSDDAASSNIISSSNTYNNKNVFKELEREPSLAGYNKCSNMPKNSDKEQNNIGQKSFDSRNNRNGSNADQTDWKPCLGANEKISNENDDKDVEKQTWNYDSDDEGTSKPTVTVNFNNQNSSFKESEQPIPQTGFSKWRNEPKDSPKEQNSFSAQSRNKPDDNSGGNSYKNDWKPSSNAYEKNSNDTKDVEKQAWNYDSDDEGTSKPTVTVNFNNQNSSFKESERPLSQTGYSKWRNDPKDSPKEQSISSKPSFNKQEDISVSNVYKNDWKPSSDAYEKISNENDDKDVEKQSWNYDSDDEGTSKPTVTVKFNNQNSSFKESERPIPQTGYSKWHNDTKDSQKEQNSFNSQSRNKPDDNSGGNSYKNDWKPSSNAYEKNPNDSNDEGTSKPSNFNNHNSSFKETERPLPQTGYSKWRNESKDCPQEQNSFSTQSRNKPDDNSGGNSYKSDWKPSSNAYEKNCNENDDKDVEKQSWNYASDDEGSSNVVSGNSKASYAPKSNGYNTQNNDFKESPKEQKFGKNLFETRNNWNDNNRNDSNSRNDYNNGKDNNNRGRNNGDAGERKRPCKYFQEGSCRQGDNCKFLHESPATNQFSAPKIKELCPFYEHQDCYKRNACLYMHKEFPCKFFHIKSKTCPSGDNCKYSHDPLNPERKLLLEKYLGEKLDGRNDRSGSGSVHDNSDRRPHSNTPCNDDLMSDPYFQNPMQATGQSWNHNQIDFMQRQRFMMPTAYPGIIPNTGAPFTVTPLMSLYTSNSKADMKELDNLAQIVVGKDPSNKTTKSPLKVNNQELSVPGGYTPNLNTTANVRLPYGNDGVMMYGGYPAYVNDPAMMDFINMNPYAGYYQQPQQHHAMTAAYEKPWKPFILQVPVKIPYPLMNIDTDPLPHKYTDPRLRGHPSVRNSHTDNDDSANLSVSATEMSSPVYVAVDAERQLSSSSPLLSLSSSSSSIILNGQQSPLFPIGEEAFTLLATDVATRRVLDRSYLQDARFKRKKVSVPAEGHVTTPPL